MAISIIINVITALSLVYQYIVIYVCDVGGVISNPRLILGLLDKILKHKKLAWDLIIC